MTREYAKDREEYFREFHSVVAPVVVLDGYDMKENMMKNQVFVNTLMNNARRTNTN